MRYYVVKAGHNPNELAIVGAKGFTPKDMLCPAPLMPDGSVCTDPSLITLVEEEQLMGEPILVAVVDGAKVVAKEAEKAAREAAEAPRNAIKAAIAFGNQLIEDFAVENVVLGITVDGMTGSVLDTMASVSEALRSGSLHEAVARLKAIPAQNKDAKYITDVRLLVAVNKLEEYLGLSLSETLV